MFGRQWIAAAVGLLFVAGCQPQPPLDVDELVSASDPIVDNMLIGLSEKDYERHARDFSKELRKQIDPVTFPQAYDEIIGKLGAYQSHRFVRMEDQGRQVVLVYEVSFARDPHATVHVVFWKSDPQHQIAALWFESTLLNGP